MERRFAASAGVAGLIICMYKINDHRVEPAFKSIFLTNKIDLTLETLLSCIKK
ncbi:hypothetical protein BH20BAC1_BH20BAC1_24490 [soil metagenome]